MADFAATDQDDTAQRNEGGQDPQTAEVVAFNPKPPGTAEPHRLFPPVTKVAPS